MRARELRFEKVPEPEVFFRGNTRRNSLWESRRENLPDEVQEGVVYRDAGVQLRIASEVVYSDPGFWNSSNRERVKAHLKGSGQETGEQEPESREDKEKK